MCGLVTCDLGVDRLADLALGRAVDVEGHLDDDRVGVQRPGLARQASASSVSPAASAWASRSSARFLRASYSVLTR